MVELSVATVELLAGAVELLLTIGVGVTTTGVVSGVGVGSTTAAGLGSKTFKSIKVPTAIAYSSPRRFKTHPAVT